MGGDGDDGTPGGAACPGYFGESLASRPRMMPISAVSAEPPRLRRSTFTVLCAAAPSAWATRTAASLVARALLENLHDLNQLPAG